VLFRARTRQDLILKAELDKLAAARRMRVHYIVGHRSDPEPAALVSAAGLRDLVPDIAERDIYICGPEGLGTEIQHVLLEMRVPPRQIHLDPFEL
jgi:ferredoxin-NADP reductase